MNSSKIDTLEKIIIKQHPKTIFALPYPSTELWEIAINNDSSFIIEIYQNAKYYHWNQELVDLIKKYSYWNEFKINKVNKENIHPILFNFLDYQINFKDFPPEIVPDEYLYNQYYKKYLGKNYSHYDFERFFRDVLPYVNYRESMLILLLKNHDSFFEVYEILLKKPEYQTKNVLKSLVYNSYVMLKKYWEINKLNWKIFDDDEESIIEMAKKDIKILNYVNLNDKIYQKLKETLKKHHHPVMKDTHLIDDFEILLKVVNNNEYDTLKITELNTKFRDDTHLKQILLTCPSYTYYLKNDQKDIFNRDPNFQNEFVNFCFDKKNYFNNYHIYVGDVFKNLKAIPTDENFKILLKKNWKEVLDFALYGSRMLNIMIELNMINRIPFILDTRKSYQTKYEYIEYDSDGDGWRKTIEDGYEFVFWEDDLTLEQAKIIVDKKPQLVRLLPICNKFLSIIQKLIEQNTFKFNSYTTSVKYLKSLIEFYPDSIKLIDTSYNKFKLFAKYNVDE